MDHFAEIDRQDEFERRKELEEELERVANEEDSLGNYVDMEMDFLLLYFLNLNST